MVGHPLSASPAGKTDHGGGKGENLGLESKKIIFHSKKIIRAIPMIKIIPKNNSSIFTWSLFPFLIADIRWDPFLHIENIRIITIGSCFKLTIILSRFIKDIFKQAYTYQS